MAHLWIFFTDLDTPLPFRLRMPAPGPLHMDMAWQNRAHKTRPVPQFRRPLPWAIHAVPKSLAIPIPAPLTNAKEKAHP